MKKSNQTNLTNFFGVSSAPKKTPPIPPIPPTPPTPQPLPSVVPTPPTPQPPPSVVPTPPTPPTSVDLTPQPSPLPPSVPKGRKTKQTKPKEPPTKKPKPQPKTPKTNSNFKPPWLNSTSPPNKGKKSLPQGKPNCLKGKVFIVTGVLDSLEREEAWKLIVDNGGEVVKTMAKKTNHALVGSDAGESKLKEIKDRNIPIFSEDDLFLLIDPNYTNNLQQTLPVDTPVSASTPILTHQTPQNQDFIISNHGKFNTEVSKNVNTLWTTKYQPSTSFEIIGNKSIIDKFRYFVKDWKIGTCCVLWGPTGVGKTLTARLVLQEEGFTIIEINSLKERNKTKLQSFFQSFLNSCNITNNEKIAFLIDEIETMSVSDRGGIGEIAAFIQKNNLGPLVCTTLDASDQKVRPITSKSLTLQFVPPSFTDLSPLLQKMKSCLPEEEYEGDIRQFINQSQISLSNEILSKDKQITPLESIRKAITLKTKSNIDEMLNYFFVDSQLTSFLLHDHFLSTFGTSKNDITKISCVCDSFSDSDLLDRNIMSNNHWELSPAYGLLSFVKPIKLLPAYSKGPHFMKFPTVFGKMSQTNKRNRILNEFKIKGSFSRETLQNLFYLILDLLLVQNVKQAISIINSFGFTKIDFENMVEIFDIDEKYQNGVSRKDKTLFTKGFKSKETDKKPKSKNTKNPIIQTTDDNADGVVEEIDEDFNNDEI